MQISTATDIWGLHDWTEDGDVCAAKDGVKHRSITKFSDTEPLFRAKDCSSLKPADRSKTVPQNVKISHPVSLKPPNWAEKPGNWQQRTKTYILNHSQLTSQHQLRYQPADTCLLRRP